MLYAGNVVNPVLLPWQNPRGYAVLRKCITVEHAAVFTIGNILHHISAINDDFVVIEHFAGLLAQRELKIRRQNNRHLIFIS
ncbi:hypothetical protein D3C77_580670 [compost metagenome]